MGDLTTQVAAHIGQTIVNGGAACAAVCVILGADIDYSADRFITVTVNLCFVAN